MKPYSAVIYSRAIYTKSEFSGMVFSPSVECLRLQMSFGGLSDGSYRLSSLTVESGIGDEGHLRLAAVKDPENR